MPSFYHRQDFSFPNSVIYQIIKNPSSPKVYQKLIKTCKYFFAKNSILIIHCLYFDENGWQNCYDCFSGKKDRNFKSFDLIKESFAKIWITDKLVIFPDTLDKTNIASDFGQRLYQSKNVQSFNTVLLKNQIIAFDNELFNYSLFKNVHLQNISVKCKNGTEVSMDMIFSVFTNAKIFAFDPNTTIAYNSETVEHLLKIPHLKNVTQIYIQNLSESFDINKFYEFLKKNRNISAILFFNDTISDQYRNRLKEIVNELFSISADNSDKYIPFAMAFPAHENEKVLSLYDNLIKWYKD